MHPLMRPWCAGALGLLLSQAIAYDPIDEVPPGFEMPEPLSLAESRASFHTHDGLHVELVAAEPLLADPINLDWGPDGKLWVVEMADYPLGIDGEGKPGGRVRFLEDRDGDGTYDHSELFLEGLNFPTAVKAWRRGVLVVAAPEILYAEDTDGDGRADEKTVLYRGFKEGNQQHRVNGLVWGLDNWLHLANGDSGGTVISEKTGDTVKLGNFDLRIDPDSGGLALETGRTQFGRARDNYGNWFGCSNSKPLFHFVLPDPYHGRNPHFPYPSATRTLAGGGFAPPVFPAPETAGHAVRFNDPFAASRFTSACGLTIQRDPRLGTSFNANAFVCEPVHNLVHRQILEPDGVTFQSRRAANESDREFLTSTDTWFRPVTARTGPDGALWIVDMHRFVIEHPKWIPETWQRVLDLRAGHHLGRIYRIVSDQTGSAVPPLLADLHAKELVPHLADPNGWVRDTAHQLLLSRKDSGSIPLLLDCAAHNAEPLARMHALCILDGLNALDAPQVLVALDDASPAVRRHAVRLSERFAPSQPALAQELASLAEDPDSQVRFQLALTLGAWPQAEAGAALSRLALNHSDDPYLVAAAASALTPHFLTVAEAAAKADFPLRAPLLPALMETAIGTGEPLAIARLLEARDADPDARFGTYATFLSALDRRGLKLSDYLEKAPPPLAAALDKAAGLTAAARQLANDTRAPQVRRLAAISLLGRAQSDHSADMALLLQLLQPQAPIEVQRAALRRLADAGQVTRAFGHWVDFTPSLRASLVGECLGKRDLTEDFLAALENGTIPPSSIDAANRDRLQRFPNSKIRAHARALFASVSNPDRQAVIQRYAPALARRGDADAGRAVFQSACIACHQLDGIGQPLGPDLTALSDSSPGALLTAILDPNRAVEDKYLLYTVSLADDTSLAGMIREESGNSLALQLLDGAARNLLRSEIRSIQSTGISAMPEGLESTLDPAQLADLITFLRRTITNNSR